MPAEIRVPADIAAAGRVRSEKTALGRIRSSLSDFGALALLAIIFTSALAVSLLAALILGSKANLKSSSAAVIVETTCTVVLVLAAYLASKRAWRKRGFVDALLAGTLVVFALVNVCFYLLPTALREQPLSFVSWAAFSGGVIVALSFAFAAFLPQRGIAKPQLFLDRILMIMLAGIGLATAAGMALTASGDHNRVEIGHTTQRLGNIPLSSDHSLLVATQLAVIAIICFAAWGFTRRAQPESETFFMWVGIGLGLYAVSNLDYLIASPIELHSLYIGDIFRLGAFTTILFGSYRESESYQRHLTEEAIFAERRRLARELHDGLAQELAYITAQTRYLVGEDPERKRTSDRLISAAERALVESRLAIAALTRPGNEPLDETIRDVATSLGTRLKVNVKLHIERQIELKPEARETLLRMISEAITNASRHGDASEVLVSLAGSNGLQLKITDNGRGFDTTKDNRPDSFGLISMSERAEALNGSFHIYSKPGLGTEITIEIPASYLIFEV